MINNLRNFFYIKHPRAKPHLLNRKVFRRLHPISSKLSSPVPHKTLRITPFIVMGLLKKIQAIVPTRKKYLIPSTSENRHSSLIPSIIPPVKPCPSTPPNPLTQ
jgi:hypothetical protein